MVKIKTSDVIDHHRRRFFGTAAMTVAAAHLGMLGSAAPQSGKAKAAQLPAMKPGTHTSFAALKQVDAGLPNVDMPRRVPQMSLRSFFCTAGPMTFTALSMSLHRSRFAAQEARIHQLIVIGLIAHTCIEATVRFAAEIGYEVTVVKDATADYSDEAMHAALDINMPNYASAIISTEEIVASISAL